MKPWLFYVILPLLLLAGISGAGADLRLVDAVKKGPIRPPYAPCSNSALT